MFKKRERPAAARQADKAEGEGETGAVPTAAKKTRAAVTNASSGSLEGSLIAASTKRTEVDAAAKLENKMDDSTLSGLKASGADGARPSDDAVRLLEIETEVGKDMRAIHERNEAIHKGLKEGTLEAGVYRGQQGYKRYMDRSEGAISASKYSGLLGPTRNTMSNVRSTMRIEYWNASSGTDGGICKDYKETGYCGFGDSCKFLHDRSDYKQGYQLEKEWEEKQKKIAEEKIRRWEKRMQKRAELGADGGDSSPSDTDSDDEELPQACPQCDTKWEQCKSIPIQTICGHHFCEDCAMEGYAASPACMACGAPTNGIFNSCDALEEKIKQKKVAKQQQKQKASGRADPFNVDMT